MPVITIANPKCSVDKSTQATNPAGCFRHRCQLTMLVTVDRGVLGSTRIGAGTKVDNQVQIAHNDQIGKHCLIVSQVGTSGSVKVGDYVTLAGKVGVSGHLEIGARSIVGGNSVVAKSLPEGSFVTGYPARPHKEWAEAQAALNRLPRFMKELRKKGGG